MGNMIYGYERLYVVNVCSAIARQHEPVGASAFVRWFGELRLGITQLGLKRVRAGVVDR